MSGRPFGPVFRPSVRLEQALGDLSERDRRALVGRYLDSLTFRELGGRFGVSIERARQIVHRAEKRLAVAYVADMKGAPGFRYLTEDPRPDRRWTTLRRPEPFGTLDEILDALEALPGPTRDEILEAAVRASGSLDADDPRVRAILFEEGIS